VIAIGPEGGWSPRRKKKEEQKQKQLGCALFVEPSPRSAAVRGDGHRGQIRFPQENGSDLFVLHPTPHTACAFAIRITS
ncbi:hypothetical protein, partial [Stenotrophomonas maltophilia]|uniref:hypothetical protein n=1 Tax=Stenotrophomonas maltophilia TaxID=40324 RepID=UPI001955EF42